MGNSATADLGAKYLGATVDPDATVDLGATVKRSAAVPKNR